MADNQLLDLPVPTGGMNTDQAAHVIPDEQAVLIQDQWVWKPGRLIARGPLARHSAYTNFQTWSTNGASHGLFGVRFPNSDKERYIAVTNSSGNGNLQFHIYEPDTNTRTDRVQFSISGSYTRPLVMNVSPAIRGGVYIGFAQSANEGVGNQVGFFYTGSKMADYSSTGWNTWTIGTASPTVLTRPGGGLSTGLEAGMALYRWDSTNMQFVGVVKSVNSDTQITLEAPALAAYAIGTDTIYGYPRIPYHQEIAKGQLTVASGSTSVLGLGTRFKAMGVAQYDRVFRRKDNAFIGLVNSVTDDETLTLVSGATTSLAEEDYFMLHAADNNQIAIGADFNSQQAPGWLSAAYAGRQWFANRGSGSDISGKYVNRLWWSEVDNPFSVDFAVDGDHLHVESERAVDEPIVALKSVEGGLLILKYSESYLLTGTTPDDFQVTKILDDGCLGCTSVQSYHNGAIWAGRNGIYYWDGSSVENLIQDKLTTKWKSHTQVFDTGADRVYGTVYNDHYLVYFDKASGNALNFGNNVRGVVTSTPKHTLAIYIPNRASTVLTNVYPRGSYIPGNPALPGLFITNIGGTHHIFVLDTLWKEQDTFDYDAMDGGSVGPDCYVQTKQYDAQTPSVKKIIKVLLLNYRAFGTPIVVNTLVGLNDAGIVTNASFPANISFQTKRIKFMRRSQFLGFRFYMDPTVIPKCFYLNRIALLYRPQRLGRP